jgi:hypothetical protein
MTIGVILELEMGTIELTQLVSGVLAVVLLALILRRRKRRLEL